jgi:hypothetical protein
MPPNAVFGSVFERSVAQEIANSPLHSQLFEWAEDIDGLQGPGISTPGDFIGIGPAQGQLFELTTVGQAAGHASRWDGMFGDLVHISTYTYPFPGP